MDGICSLKLLTKVHGNLNFKIIDKSDLSIFYSYDFNNLTEEQYNLAIYEASQVMYAMTSVITGKIIFPEHSELKSSYFDNRDFKDVALLFKVFFDLVYGNNTVTLVNLNGANEFSEKSKKKTLDHIEYNLKKIKTTATFSNCRYILKMFYLDQYLKLPPIELKEGQNLDDVLTFSIDDYYLFEKGIHFVPLDYFKLLARFFEHIEKIHYQLSKEQKK